MKIAGVSHRGGLWGEVETDRNVFECVSANTPISAKCSSSQKIVFRESNYSALVEDSIDSSMASQPSSLYHSLKRLPHAHRR